MSPFWRRLLLCGGNDVQHAPTPGPPPQQPAKTTCLLSVAPKALNPSSIDAAGERKVEVREGVTCFATGRGEVGTENSADCPICLTELAERAVYSTECGHHFHHCCIGDWMRSGRQSATTCPVCRSSISGKPVKELLWESTTFGLATDADIQANLQELRRVIQTVDERNRNLGSKNVFGKDGVKIQYFVTGRIRTLYESNQSYYYIVFALKDKIYEASVDTSESVAFYMSLKVKMGPNVEFNIEYVDH